MTQAISASVTLTHLNTGDRHCTKIYRIPHALHTVIADLVRIQIASVTFTASVANLVVIQQAHFLFGHFTHLKFDYSICKLFLQVNEQPFDFFAYLCYNMYEQEFSKGGIDYAATSWR